MKEKSARNKTIDFDITEGSEYLKKCIRKEQVSDTLDSVRNQFIIGNSMEVMELLPRQFVDLLIVDPPYNLMKDYHGNRFNAKSSDEYRKYTVCCHIFSMVANWR